MNYELSIIKAMLSYDTWLSYSDKLSVKDLPKEIQPLFSVLDGFHRQHPAVDLTVADLANLVLAQPHRDLDYIKAVLGNLETLSVSDTTTEVLLKSFYDKKLLKEISLAAYEVTEGKGSREALDKLLSQLSQKSEDVSVDIEFVTDDLEQLLNETFRQPGLRWRLNTLNRMLGSLRSGDFGFIFARPETGKTTFLASETTYMAQQLREDQGPVIWLNNEEGHNKVRIRCFQATLGATLAQINANPEAARNAFLQATKGKHQLVKTSGPIHKEFVETLIRKYKPSLVIYDVIDKLAGFKADREDLLMGSIYQWARELAKVYQHAAIGVCQADGSGEGQKWLTMGNVANAKTAKQAEADWILGIGKTMEPGYEYLRFLNLSKNKLAGDEDTDPALRHGKSEVLIEPAIGRYKDIQ